MTNSTVQNPSWEADSHSFSQDIHRRLWNQKFIIVFIVVCHWSISWVRWIQSTTSNPVFLRYILVLSSTPSSPKWSIPLVFFHWNFVRISHFSHACNMPRSSYPLRYDRIDLYLVNVQVMKFLIMKSSPFSCHFLPLKSLAPRSQTLSILFRVCETKFHNKTKQN
jgi:hypothetical protein